MSSQPGSGQGPGEIGVEQIGQASRDDLNRAIGEPMPEIGVSLYDSFNEDGLLQAFDPGSMGAGNGVSLYRISHDTVIPETGERQRVSGLLAIPDLAGLSERRLPLVSWQHGTIFEAAEAPSMLFENGAIRRGRFGVPRSAETLFNVVRLAGNGYVLAAADYVGNGLSKAPQAYAVKDAMVQTMLDMLQASEEVLKQQSVSVGPLMLNGWSQGALNTQWLGWALQQRGATTPARLAAVSGPSDLRTIVRYWMNDYPGTPNWLTAAMPLLFGAYERYYGLTDLMARAIRSEYLTIARHIYNQTYDWDQVDWTSANPISLAGGPGTARVALPAIPRQMLNPTFLEACNAGEEEFSRLISANSALQGTYRMPSRFYGGSSDSVVPGWSSMLFPVETQQQGGSSLASAVSVTMGLTGSHGCNPRPGGTHRSTFLSSLFDPGLSLLRWFDGAAT